MTLIIAQAEADRILMASDSAGGTPEEFYVLPHFAKIARCGPYLVGACGSARIMQILHHCVAWQEPPDVGDRLPFLVQEVVPEVRRAVQEAGAANTGRQFLGEKTAVLFGVRGELYCVGTDLTVVRWSGPACIGCACVATL